MENYEKKYKNALEWAKQVMTGETGFIRKEVEEVFPELAESEDERIRKELISYFKQFDNGELRGVNISDWTAWLESLKDRLQSKQEYNEEAAETSAKKYRDYREKSGIKELVTLDETEDAYYNGFLDALQTEWYKED